MKKSGLTLMELMLVMIGMSILFGVGVFAFLAASKAVQRQQERISPGEELSQGLQKVARELREAADDAIGDSNGTITQSSSTGGSGNIANTIRYQDVEDNQFYVLYLYGIDGDSSTPDDTVFDSSYISTVLYQLRLAPAAGFTYGSGRILARTIMSPNASDPVDQAVIQRGSGREQRRIELILTATQISGAVSQKSEKVKMRLMIRPRNQGNSVI
ncbi:MAG: hypothetical protein HY590_01025 [Candidatus Omnitrophica bacterium]|nr:hypothetical protein [Candidatus Omnitrophota bacterium]